MKKLSLTLIYTLSVVFAACFFKVQGTTQSNETEMAASITLDPKEASSIIPIPKILVSNPDKPLPEPISFSLFGFGLFMVVGLGWIKKVPEKH